MFRRKLEKTGAYTHEEISKIIEIADEKMRVVILLLTSSGIRLGSSSLLKLRNLYDKLTVYENDTEEYFTL